MQNKQENKGLNNSKYSPLRDRSVNSKKENSSNSRLSRSRSKSGDINHAEKNQFANLRFQDNKSTIDQSNSRSPRENRFTQNNYQNYHIDNYQQPSETGLKGILMNRGQQSMDDNYKYRQATQYSDSQNKFINKIDENSAANGAKNGFDYRGSNSVSQFKNIINQQPLMPEIIQSAQDYNLQNDLHYNNYKRKNEDNFGYLKPQLGQVQENKYYQDLNRNENIYLNQKHLQNTRLSNNNSLTDFPKQINDFHLRSNSSNQRIQNFNFPLQQLSQNQINVHQNKIPEKIQFESDPYAPSLVQDLLLGKNEWKNIQDIVKLTFKAVCDTVKSQGNAIGELERQIQSKASIIDMQTNFSMKANVSDVSRTIADIQMILDSKQSYDDVQKLLDDKVTKQDLQYMLSNKVSIEELSKILLQKSNIHEVNMELSQLNLKIDEIQKDLNKRLNSTALQKDLAYLTTLVDKKSDLDFINEALSQKANKQSVANALHRKANRSDVDEILLSKADISEIKSLQLQINSKVDNIHIDELSKIIDKKCDKQELEIIRNELNQKALKNDLDILQVQLQNFKIETVQKMTESEKDIDEFIESIQNELGSMKNTMIQSLNKKADFSMLDRLNEIVAKKVDNEHMKQNQNQLKSEMMQHLDLLKQDINIEKQSRDQKLIERQEKNEILIERAMDEIFQNKERIKLLQEDRKRDIEDTADFIKQVMDQLKENLLKEYQQLKMQIDQTKSELIDKCSIQEMLQTKLTLTNQLDSKVEVKEVQNALNECQQDLAEQLNQFKIKINDKIQAVDVNLNRIIDRKVDHKDLKSITDSKADRIELLEKFILKTEFDLARDSINEIQINLQNKLNNQDFYHFEKNNEIKIEELYKQMQRKSNIKDVCALLDMKSNTEEVNRALDEIHNEMDKVLVTKQELNNALQEQTTINEALCAENCSARWLWKSGDLQNGFAIPWEIQTINTCPENFLWDEDKSMILTIAPGLYEINFGFFSSKQPTIQVLVNGEPILSAVNSSSYVIHHSAGKLKQTGKQHSAGNLTGLTMIDFIALPARARISLSYTGDKKCEGFLGLRKL